MSYFGVDISEHNGSVDFAKLKNNVDFVILRLGWVGNKNNHTLDKRFKSNYEACKKYGIKVGAYVYMYSNSEDHAKEGSTWAIKQLKGLTFDLPIYCDMEDKSIVGLGKTKLSAIATVFCTAIEKAGYWAGVYANKNWFDNYLTREVANRFTTWIAHYTSGRDKYKGVYAMWQNSSSGHVAGINGRVDTNYLYRDLFSAISKKKPETATKTETDSKNNYSNGAEKFDSKYKNGEKYKVFNAPSGLYIREGAGTKCTKLALLPNGTEVIWYGYYTVINGVIWRYVKVASGKYKGTVGYCSGKYLK